MALMRSYERVFRLFTWASQPCPQVFTLSAWQCPSQLRESHLCFWSASPEPEVPSSVVTSSFSTGGGWLSVLPKCSWPCTDLWVMGRPTIPCRMPALMVRVTAENNEGIDLHSAEIAWHFNQSLQHLTTPFSPPPFSSHLNTSFPFPSFLWPVNT